jgi:RNA polymerase sigma factor (sigma-70 family)
MPHRDIDDWFVEEVLILEAALVGFLRRNWRGEADILDFRQETYARVYESAQKQRPVYAKAFVFMTARNLMIDRARRAQVVSMETIADFETLPVLESEPDAEERLSSRQELKALQKALDLLPSRCREIVVMRKIEGRSQRDVAKTLGISESTVEKQVSKGVQKLANVLYGEGGAYEGDATARARAQQERQQ